MNTKYFDQIHPISRYPPPSQASVFSNSMHDLFGINIDIAGPKKPNCDVLLLERYF
jgi:hypothetical protein